MASGAPEGDLYRVEPPNAPTGEVGADAAPLEVVGAPSGGGRGASRPPSAPTASPGPGGWYWVPWWNGWGNMATTANTSVTLTW